MNKVILMGRLTRDPDIRYTQGENASAIAKFTLAVDRRMKRNNDQQQTADFIYCTAFGKLAEFAEKYARKGVKFAVTGRIQTGSYTNKDGIKVYTTDVIVEEMEFAESKASNERYAASAAAAPAAGQPQAPDVDADGFMNVPDVEDEELPFN